MYGNYDGLNKGVIFDLHIGVNYWRTVNISDPDKRTIAEVIFVAPVDYIQVCLVNSGLGTPFISSLDLRPMKNRLYPFANSSQSLVLAGRLNAGPTDTTIIRYPDDPHDRMWEPWSNEPTWAEITTTSCIQNIQNDLFEVPSAVLQTAVTPVNSLELKTFWTADPLGKDPEYLANFHFSELMNLTKDQKREFNLIIQDVRFSSEPFTPAFLLSNAIYLDNPVHGLQQYNVTIKATVNSTLPPILNAVEVFMVLPVFDLPTDSADVSTINAIKSEYQIKRDWYGDPCAPKSYAWDGLNCSYAVSSSPRITVLNLASSGLTGEITNAFGNLKAVQTLVGDNVDLCYDGTECHQPKKKSGNSKIAIAIIAQHLTKIHHRNLVSLIGYCNDENYLALVLEYMSEGSLQDRLKGRPGSSWLTWKERIRIALDSAKGLEYLHKGCNPRIIHQDIKPHNILLNERLEAKIADFGVSKAFSSNDDTHVSVKDPVGTYGYIDPEYYVKRKVTEKSDVYSFGVVLLQIITGQPAIIQGTGPESEPVNVSQWVRQRLSRGNIDSVVDARMQGDYDINSVWNAAKVALECTEMSGVHRPTMADVIVRLQECIELEAAVGRNRNGVSRNGVNKKE
ncbi:hypothetical protein LUZ61_007802 [Rhynchospora tenuis]|uniref:Protein kinase domain-containing protein n=1 Tax=Rhynchospora tenuis TaxID=198213 RepID=A0AAD6EWU1_9POAL|nr:hypothetical protein LUZ61_007802 [Rhynchospora tenuis]